MSNKLEGAYVQAWVWVDAEGAGIERQDTSTSEGRIELDRIILTAAKNLYHLDGEIEIDDDAEISLSYEGG